MQIRSCKCPQKQTEHWWRCGNYDDLLCSWATASCNPPFAPLLLVFVHTKTQISPVPTQFRTISTLLSCQGESLYCCSLFFFCSSKSWLKDNLSCSSIQEGPLAAFLFEHSGGQLILNDNVKHYCFYFNPSFLLNFTVAYFFFIRFLFSFLLSF